MNFGWFILQPFSRSILWLLKFLHSFGINYGIILVLIPVFVRVVTGPLTKKGHQSAQKMQAIQPKLKKIQEKHTLTCINKVRMKLHVYYILIILCVM